MNAYSLIVASWFILGFTQGRIFVRDVHQDIQEDPIEELQNLLTDQMEELNDVGPEEDMTENTGAQQHHQEHLEEEQQQEDLDDLQSHEHENLNEQQLQERENEHQSVHLEEQQSEDVNEQQSEDEGEAHGQTYKTIQDVDDLVKIELNRDQCTQESLYKCFDPLKGSYQEQDPDLTCEKTRLAVDCVTELVDICADSSQREQIQLHLDAMDAEVRYICEREHEEQLLQEELERESVRCVEEQIGIDYIVTHCGKVARENILQQSAEEELTQSDILCLSYKHSAKCTSDRAEEVCGKTIANYLYSQMIEAVNRFDALKGNRFCAFGDEQEGSSQSSVDDDDSQQQQVEDLPTFLLRRKRRDIYRSFIKLL